MFLAVYTRVYLSKFYLTAAIERDAETCRASFSFPVLCTQWGQLSISFPSTGWGILYSKTWIEISKDLLGYLLLSRYFSSVVGQPQGIDWCPPCASNTTYLRRLQNFEPAHTCSLLVSSDRTVAESTDSSSKLKMFRYGIFLLIACSIAAATAFEVN